MKLAVVFQSSPFDRKGLFNAVHERVRHLLEQGGFEIDVYCLYTKDNALTRSVRHLQKVPYDKEVTYDGITYHMLWYNFSILDAVLCDRLHRKPLFLSRTLRKFSSLLKDYDCVSAHSYQGGLLAYDAFLRYGTRYYINWHGSDIHSHPWQNSYQMSMTKLIAENALMNFYVGESLAGIGQKIAPGSPSGVLSNGVSDKFYRFPDVRREGLRQRFGVRGRKTVIYAGNFYAVKNVLSLPEIFRGVIRKYSGNVTFWVVGDGKQRAQLLDGLYEMASSENVSIRSPWRFSRNGDSRVEIVLWGNARPEAMPLIMNCADVVVMPSRNEGSPLVCAEALRCGAAVVGASVCGIKDILDRDHLVDYGPDFCDGFSAKVVASLTDGKVQKLPSFLDWTKTAQKEAAFLKSCYLSGNVTEK